MKKQQWQSLLIAAMVLVLAGSAGCSALGPSAPEIDIDRDTKETLLATIDYPRVLSQATDRNVLGTGILDYKL